MREEHREAAVAAVWEELERVTVLRWRMGEVQVLIVRVNGGREHLPWFCPVCGAKVDEVRRLEENGRRHYFTRHGKQGELHQVGVFG